MFSIQWLSRLATSACVMASACGGATDPSDAAPAMDVRDASPAIDATDTPSAMDTVLRSDVVDVALADRVTPSDGPTGDAGCAPVRELMPGQDLAAALTALCPGSTLRIHPGTWDLGAMRPAITPGTATAPIVVTAFDPTQPPLIRGWLILAHADYWTLSHLRFEAVVAGREAMTVAGGLGWTVTDSEFTGAIHTGAFANVAISADSTGGTMVQPRDWRFVSNCVHDAGPGTLPGHTSSTDHNVYVNTTGPSPGLIARNIFFNATNGENIKVGTGGCATCPAAAGVTIEYNTMYNAARQILLLGTVTGMTVRGNLLIRSTGATAAVGTYLASLQHPLAATVVHNYGYLMNANVFAPGPTTPADYTATDNPIGADPLIVASCTGFQPRNATAAQYGRWTTHVW